MIEVTKDTLKKFSGVAMAIVAAGMFMTANVSTAIADEAAMVHCGGINGCEGQSACKSAKNSCKGQNGCRGEGWQPVKTEKECTEKGGKVMKM